MSFIGKIIRFVIERSARNKTLPELTQDLEESKEVVSGRLQKAADTPKNRQIAQHVIGIERWAQSRLQTTLGASRKRDEHDDYLPDGSLDMSGLAQAFGKTRQESIRLAK